MDTETTGLSWQNGDRVVEIGAVVVEERSLTGEKFHCYLNPEGRTVSSEVENIIKLRQEFLAQQPVFKEIWPEFKQFLQGAEQLIAHNASFDMAFLDAEIARVEPGAISLSQQYEVIDSLVLARRKYPGQRNSLDALCKRYKIDLRRRELEGHGALLDAELLFKVYSALTAGTQRTLEMVEAADLAAPEVAAVAATSAPPATDYQLKVVAANAEELAAHQAMLALLQKHSPQVIWEEKYE